ncbi:MAG: hypothetical protein ACRYFR_14290 [Janthinobacterium lividum]
MTKTLDFNIDFKALATCAPAMSNEETRYYLCGVHIFEREGQVIYETTNGHFLIQVISEQLQADMDFIGLNIIVPAFLVNNLAKKSFQKGFGVTKDELLVACHVDNLRLNVEMNDGLINFKLIDGTFPDTSRVIPDAASCKERNLSFDELGFNASYMDKLYKSERLNGGLGMIKLAFSDENQGPIRVTGNLPNWLAVLMPTRI